jgi:WD40 repeat protein
VAHEGKPVSGVAFLPDGKRLASAGYDGTAALWNAATGREHKRLRLDEATAFCLALSGDGWRLFTGGWFLIEEWDVAAGKRLRRLGKKPETIEIGREQPLSSLVVSPDGEIVGIEQHGRLRLWKRGVEQAPDRVPQLTSPAAFSADGKTLAARPVAHTLAKPQSLSLWETATGQERLRLAWPPQWNRAALAFGPRGSRLATADGAEVHVWDATTGALLHTFRGHQGEVSHLAFSPDGKALVSGSADTTALVWDVSRILPRKPAPLAPGDVKRLWADLGGHDGRRAYRAARALAGSPRLALPFLAERLRPVKAPEARLVARRLAELDSDDFATRQKANAELAGWGETVERDLERALRSKPSAEARRQLERLLKRLRSDSPLSAEELRILRAVEALEHAGTADAERLLRRLAGGAAPARLSREARAAVERLSRLRSLR